MIDQPPLLAPTAPASTVIHTSRIFCLWFVGCLLPSHSRLWHYGTTGQILDLGGRGKNKSRSTHSGQLVGCGLASMAFHGVVQASLYPRRAFSTHRSRLPSCCIAPGTWVPWHRPQAVPSRVSSQHTLFFGFSIPCTHPSISTRPQCRLGRRWLWAASPPKSPPRKLPAMRPTTRDNPSSPRVQSDGVGYKLQRPARWDAFDDYETDLSLPITRLV
ncbi:hypothetical protein B0H63DRAFT_266817 [Podospora didyma]|uniref:Uncharacterized protein n=1 Tax=Podospora didyma TaxID=330526 RepID=A0AAE0KEM1_9PEZI|nr:hypothetical protein B0H63DRAFT_266817 [Podospora didyma]